MKNKLQLNLNQEEANPWEDICCQACWFAKGEKCECRCGGAHHGKGSHRNQEENHLKRYYPSAQKYMKQLNDPVCRFHQEPVDLSGEIIWGYPHSDGWKVEESDEKQWLYIICPVCAYEWALWKLGIKKDGI